MSPHLRPMISSAKHTQLAQQILSDDRRVTLISALPGTGQGALLRAVAEVGQVGLRDALPERQDGGLIVADLRDRPITGLPAGDARLVLCCAAERFPDVARLRLTGDLRIIGNQDLFLSPDTAQSFEHSAGWPILSECFARADGPETVVADLRAFLGAALSPAQYDAILLLCRARHGFEADTASDDARAALDGVAPLAEIRSGRWCFRTEGIGALLRQVTADWPAEPRTLEWIENAGTPVGAMTHAVASGRLRHAHDILRRNGGMFLLHLRGEAAARRALAAFGDDPDPEVVGLSFVLAVKSGDTERAAHLLDRAWQYPLSDTSRPLKTPHLVPETLLLCRILLAAYRTIGDANLRLAEASALLPRLASSDHLRRGLLFNCIVDLHVGSEALDEVEQAAIHALHHYEAAQAPYLCYYIHVHKAIVRLMAGQPKQALAPVRRAARTLAQVPFDTPQDDDLLALLQAVVAYEQGSPEAVARFAERFFDRYARGEIWSSIAQLALGPGAHALLFRRGLEAARSYLDGWQVEAWRTRRFRIAIAQRQVAVLQTAQRWHEAGQQLDGMATRIGRIWMLSTGRALSDLRNSEDIAQALLWLRQQVHDTPRDTALLARLAAFQDNPRLSPRNHMTLHLWTAWMLRRLGRVHQARKMLADTLATCAARQCLAPILEERQFVMQMLDDARVMQGVMLEAPIPSILRHGSFGHAKASPLTRQEWRALLLLVEGCSNKDIARDMAVSLPTVKFHLKNLYAKLGASDRRDAVRLARANGVVDI